MTSTALTFELERRGPFDPDSVAPADARRCWQEYRAAAGYARGNASILTAPDGNLKLAKDSVPTYGLTLSAADGSGHEACVWRTPGCTAGCVLATSFRGKSSAVRDARAVRTRFLADHPAEAIALIAFELRRAVRKHGSILVRLNVASDLRWEYIAPALFDIPGARFYDYTKAPRKHRGTHPNYRLTFSVSERARSEREATEYLAAGGTAAVVFDIRRGGILPATWHGFDVIDGDASDNRTADPAGAVVGLRVKADGRIDSSGFVKAGIAT